MKKLPTDIPTVLTIVNNQAHFKNLVNETMASIFTQTFCKKFSVVDLWYIQRREIGCRKREHSF
jgi:hypothetical protein